MGDVADIQISLLDGVGLTAAGVEIALRGDRQRALLARLALSRGSEVPRDVLIDDVWGGRPGKSGSGALRVQVKRLREHLAPMGLDDHLETTPGGYRLSAAVVVDADLVQSAVERAEHVSDQDPQAACGLLDDVARSLSGAPLRGLEDLLFSVVASQRLVRLQSRATMLRARLCAETGRVDEAITQLTLLGERTPTDEGVAATLMDVLVSVGQNRDALAVAHRLRTDLAEIGLMPGAEVLRREQTILNPEPVSPESTQPGLTGRSTETRRLLECLDALGGGVGATATISGPAGIGKTVLAQLVVTEALERGWQVYTAMADEMERQRPFQLLHWLHLQRPGARAEMLDLSSWLVDVPEAGDPGGFDPGGTRLSVASRASAAAAAIGEPIVVLAEDLHWADGSSLALLRALSRTARQHPVLLVLTGRPSADWQHALGDLPRIDITLGPMTDDDTRQLAEQHVGGSLGPDLATAVAAAGGNPLLVVEYLRGLELEDRLVRVGTMVDSSGSGSPTSVQNLASRRLRSLPTELIEVLEVASVVGRQAPVDLLARLCRTDLDHLVELLQQVEVTGIATFDGGRLSYQHDLLRDAVYAAIEDERRGRLHGEVAGRFAGEGRPIISVAAHAALSGAERDDQTVAWMREAAAEACAVEPLTSVAFLDQALELAHGLDERFVLQHAKVEALTTAGELKAATELVDVLVHARRPETAMLQVRYAGLMMAQAKAAEARQILAAVDTEALTPELATRWGALTGLCSYAAFDQPAAREHAERAIEVGRRADDAIGLSMAHGVVGRCDLMSHRYREGLRAGRLSAEYADADPTGGGHLYLPWYFVGMTLLDIDEHSGVEDALHRGRAASQRHHLHFSRPLYLTLETALAQRTGDLERAFRCGVEVLEIEQQLGYSLISAWVRALLSLAALESGDLDLAVTYCDDAERAQAAGSPQGGHIVALARAEIQRISADWVAAFAGLREAWQFFDAFALHACKTWIAPALTRAAVHVGDGAVTDMVYAEMVRLSDRSDEAVHRATHSWVDGLIGHDEELLGVAADGLSAVGRHRDAAVCRGDVARIGR